VLSTRYGKIEDLLLSLRVATPATGLIETVPVPRHAVGPELTQLFVGSEGTLGVITRATLQLVPVPAERRFAAVAFPSVHAGIHAIRRTLQAGHRPSVVRMYDEDATRLAFAPVVGEDLSGVYTVLAFEGEPDAVDVEERRTLELAAEAGAELLAPAIGKRWWDRRYDFYHPPHQPELPAIWGTLDVVASYARIEAVYEALHNAVRVPYAETGLELRMHFSHWYPWGTMIYGRFVVPDGGPDALELHDRIWADGMNAALDAGGVMNDHHGVGIKLGPYMRRQHGRALDALRGIKAALDPDNIMNPGKMGL
jgi:alkyldihydroxyacetonephosphate synthase